MFNYPEDIERLRRLPYAEYLLTDWWRFVRQGALERAQHKCQICFARPVAGHHTPVRLEVHHRTYQRLGAEIPADLLVVCGECHEFLHRPGAHEDLTLSWAGLIGTLALGFSRLAMENEARSMPLAPDEAARRLIDCLYRELPFPLEGMTPDEVERLKKRAIRLAEAMRRDGTL